MKVFFLYFLQIFAKKLSYFLVSYLSYDAYGGSDITQRSIEGNTDLL